MKRLTTSELRRAYLDFFTARGHKLFKSDSLVPANDPSVLFTSAGMNQFKDHFLGKVKGVGRTTSAQKCFRTGDLEQVGMTPFHHTFFEMLGNFSFGDYFKTEATAWAWEFMTGVLGISPKQLWVSVYQDDDDAFAIWRDQIKVPTDRIRRFGAKDNFWPSDAIQEGPNGPCGPCSEIYYERGQDDSVEVWNLVFTQFDRKDGGVLEPLPQKNIDTGMGLERMASVLQGCASNFEIDIFLPIVAAVKKEAGVTDEKLVRMLADHARAVTFCIGDGVLPSNDGRGYVVRKLIRRSLHMTQGSEGARPFVYKLIPGVVEVMKDAYPELVGRRDNIAQIVHAEEEKFIKNILEGGRERLEALIRELRAKGSRELPAPVGAELYGTYGIQPDLARDLCEKAGLKVPMKEIERLIAEEQERTRAASRISADIFSTSVALKSSKFVGYDRTESTARLLQIVQGKSELSRIGSGTEVGVVLDTTPFYGESGGQVGDTGEIATKSGQVFRVRDTKKQDGVNVHVGSLSAGELKAGDEVIAKVDVDRRQAIRRSHTATHILQAVLREVLGPHVQQAGSFVEPDRFRFDFTHFKEIGPEEMEDIQARLNELVIANDGLEACVMDKTEAQKTGAIALFGEKYEDEVRVVSVGAYSKEFCGGTHLDRTGDIGLILITGSSSVGSGLRRIEAITGKLAYEEVRSQISLIKDIAQVLKTLPKDIISTLEAKNARLKMLEKLKAKKDEEDLSKKIESVAPRQINKRTVIFEKLDDRDPSLLRSTIDGLKKKFSNGVFVVSSVFDGTAYFACGSTSDVASNLLLQRIMNSVGGSGGGRKDFAQGGTKSIHQIEDAFIEAERFLEELK